MTETPLLTNRDRIGTAVLVAATLVSLTIIPDWPWKHLDDPAYWGVVGFFLVLVPLAWHRSGRGGGPVGERRLLLAFLAAMPLIYLACWLRFGGTRSALLIELAGGVIYWTITWLAARGSPWILAIGIAGHGLWDAAHYGRTDYVPDWYALACLVVDVGVGAWVAGRLGVWRSVSFSDPSPSSRAR